VLAASVTAGDIVLMILGGMLIIAGVRGPPGMKRLLRRHGIVGTWRHGALVFGALIYAIVVPTLGVMILYLGLTS
jgi:hypothetical protein